MYGDYTWRDLVNTAYEVARAIGIDERSWIAACNPAALGPEHAALCVILIHRNLCLPPKAKHLPKNPAACFGGMIRKAKTGSLDLLRFMHAVRNHDERSHISRSRTKRISPRFRSVCLSCNSNGEEQYKSLQRDPYCLRRAVIRSGGFRAV
ncbi:replication initiation protein RepC [Octadecabacter ascidiaceicola]|uniref:replication initiation protein RepC n=1 Tax=Octadecabacter ascidiaceicola TaxID=1655543 RepID=UPI000B8B6AF1